MSTFLKLCAKQNLNLIFQRGLLAIICKNMKNVDTIIFCGEYWKVNSLVSRHKDHTDQKATNYTKIYTCYDMSHEYIIQWKS